MLTRADFLRIGGGAAVAAAASYGGLRLFGGSSGAARVQSFVTRPDLAPAMMRVVTRGASTAPGLLFLAPSSGPGQRGPLIADDAGELVWFRPTSPAASMNLRVAVYRGEPVLTWWQADPDGGLGNGMHVVVDSSYRELARFPAANGRPSDLHELMLTPEGTALITSYEIRDADLSSFGGRVLGRVMGGIAQEVELPSAQLVHEWRSLDHVALEESYSRVGNAWDYFHINSIGLDDDGQLLISARNTWTVYKVDRVTGRVIWRLGGKRNDFAIGNGASFAWQHDARTHDGGRLLSLFDNGAAPIVEPHSRALVLSLDQARRRVSLLREYTHLPPVSARALGNVQLQENGNVLVGWGVRPYFSEYSRDGHVLLDVEFPRAEENYRALRFPWVGRPADPPVIARAGGQLFASWNGATEITRWHLEAGREPQSLRHVSTAPKLGFETRLEVPPGARHVSAVALDAHDRPLGRSATLRV
ncbi:MAG TPA: arylsulfotransferase family protein [Gaiellaceae bacterium]